MWVSLSVAGRIGTFLSSRRDLVPLYRAYPGLASGAIVCRPSGAGVRRHRLCLANETKLSSCLGTHAFSTQRAELFRHFVLLPSPRSAPSLRSVTQGGLRSTASLRWAFLSLTGDESRGNFESALECAWRGFRLRLLSRQSMFIGCSANRCGMLTAVEVAAILSRSLAKGWEPAY